VGGGRGGRWAPEERNRFYLLVVQGGRKKTEGNSHERDVAGTGSRGGGKKGFLFPAATKQQKGGGQGQKTTAHELSLGAVEGGGRGEKAFFGVGRLGAVRVCGFGGDVDRELRFLADGGGDCEWGGGGGDSGPRGEKKIFGFFFAGTRVAWFWFFSPQNGKEQEKIGERPNGGPNEAPAFFPGGGNFP